MIICKKRLSVICLESSKLNGGSTMAIAEAKTTLTRVYEVTLTVEPFRVVTWF
jgi:hypothetical protein